MTNTNVYYRRVQVKNLMWFKTPTSLIPTPRTLRGPFFMRVVISVIKLYINNRVCVV
jgi:hypothetical protein